MVQSTLNFGKRDTQFQKWICLDLDGTLILKHPSEGSFSGKCHPETVQTLRYAITLGWNVAIITGRTFSFAKQVLESFDFPFNLAVQQGSHFFTMPEEKLLLEHMIEKSVVHELLTFLVQNKIPTIAYLGYEEGDACLYSMEHVDEKLFAFYQKIQKISTKPWIQFPSLTQATTYRASLVKGFSHNQEHLREVQKELHQRFHVASTLIKDPLCLGQFYLLITASKATKGHIVQELLAREMLPSITIGAGDDDNDFSMLNLCTYRLVMDDAPLSLQKIATTLVSSKDPLDLSLKIRDCIMPKNG